MQSTTTCLCQHLFHGSTVGNGPARDIWLGNGLSGSLFARGMHVKIEKVLLQSVHMQIFVCACSRASNTCHLQALQTRKTGSRRSYIDSIAAPCCSTNSHQLFTTSDTWRLSSQQLQIQHTTEVSARPKALLERRGLGQTSQLTQYSARTSNPQEYCHSPRH